MEHNIILISKKEHIICIFKDEAGWGIYDPNFSHRNIESMQRMFKTKEELASTVGEILGTNLYFKIVSFEKGSKTVSEPKPLVVEPINELIAPMLNNKELMLRALELNTESKEVPDEQKAKNKSAKVWDLIIEAHFSKDDEGRIGFNQLFIHSPQLIDRILEITSQSEKYSSKFAKALVLQDDSFRDSSFETLKKLFGFVPDPKQKMDKYNRLWLGIDKSMQECISIHSESKEVVQTNITQDEKEKNETLAYEVLAECVGCAPESRFTITQRFVSLRPEGLLKYLKFISCMKEGPNYLAQASLLMNNMDGNDMTSMMYRAIVGLVPVEPLLLYFDIIGGTDKGLEQIQKLLNRSYRDQSLGTRTGTNFLDLNPSVAKPIIEHLIIMLEQSKAGPALLTKGFFYPSPLVDIIYIACKFPHLLPTYLQLLAKAKNGPQIIKNVLNDRIIGMSVLDMIKTKAPTAYPTVCKYNRMSREKKLWIAGTSVAATLVMLGVYASKRKSSKVVNDLSTTPLTCRL